MKSFHFAAEAQKVWVRNAYHPGRDRRAQCSDSTPTIRRSAPATTATRASGAAMPRSAIIFTGETPRLQGRQVRPHEGAASVQRRRLGRVPAQCPRRLCRASRSRGRQLDLASPRRSTSTAASRLAYQGSLIWNPTDYVRFMAQYGHINVTGGPRAEVATAGPPADARHLPDRHTTPANQRKYGVEHLRHARPGRLLGVDRTTPFGPSLPFGSKGSPLVQAARGLLRPGTWPKRDQSATDDPMAASTFNERALVDALDEPALVVEGSIVRLANEPRAQALSAVESRAAIVRLAIRHPQALERILSLQRGRDRRHRDRRTRPLVAAGHARTSATGSMLVRMIDRSRLGLGRKDAGRFRRQRQPRVAHALVDRAGICRDPGRGRRSCRPSCAPISAGRSATRRSRMLRIIEDLMSLSRIEADRFVPPSDSVDLAEVVNTAIANAGRLRGSATCSFDIQLPDDLPPIRGDHGQLMQVLDNLIGNAVRYGCDRPDSRIEITASRNGRWITLSVADHGPGIPREHLPRVTERFYRVDAARSREVRRHRPWPRDRQAYRRAPSRLARHQEARSASAPPSPFACPPPKLFVEQRGHRLFDLVDRIGLLQSRRGLPTSRAWSSRHSRWSGRRARAGQQAARTAGKLARLGCECPSALRRTRRRPPIPSPMPCSALVQGPRSPAPPEYRP